MSRLLVFLSVFVVMVSAFAACPGDPSACDCFICDRAVTLVLVDSVSGSAIDDFVTEYTLDGAQQGEAVCDGTVTEQNECTFGNSPGIYNIVVRAPGFDPREVSARVALEAPSSRCCSSCVRPKKILVELDPRG